MRVKCVNYLQLEYKSKSSGVIGNFVASQTIVTCCRPTGNLRYPRSLPKFNQLFSDP